MNKCASDSQKKRTRNKLKLEADMEEYLWLNSILNVYDPQSWKATAFANAMDPTPQGDTKERNKIAAKNSRERIKRRNKELHNRLMHLRKEADIQYMLYMPMDIAPIVAHDMFIKKLNKIHLPEVYLDTPIDLSTWDI